MQNLQILMIKKGRMYCNHKLVLIKIVYVPSLGKHSLKFDHIQYKSYNQTEIKRLKKNSLIYPTSRNPQQNISEFVKIYNNCLIFNDKKLNKIQLQRQREQLMKNSKSFINKEAKLKWDAEREAKKKKKVQEELKLKKDLLFNQLQWKRQQSINFMKKYNEAMQKKLKSASWVKEQRKFKNKLHKKQNDLIKQIEQQSYRNMKFKQYLQIKQQRQRKSLQTNKRKQYDRVNKAKQRFMNSEHQKLVNLFNKRKKLDYDDIEAQKEKLYKAYQKKLLQQDSFKGTVSQIINK